jgi:iron(III) transport system substrate-binding protein
VLYCSVDDVYAKPIVAELERKTGLKIDALYDVESAKTAGLANRIRAEKERPRADVFWSSALLQTLLLKREGLLQKYSSPNAKDIHVPLYNDKFSDKDSFWMGMGVRSRVIVFHEGLSQPPKTLHDLLAPRFRNKVGISNPQFGTASDWSAWLGSYWGTKQTLAYFRALKNNGVRVLPGNSVVAEKVARGELLCGVTDSDDFISRVNKKAPMRTLNLCGSPVPITIAILKGAPHEANARKLMRALLRHDTLLAKKMPGVWLTYNESAPNDAAASREWMPGYDSRGKPLLAAKWLPTWDEIREPIAQILLSD